MGVMTRRVGEAFVITSDRDANGVHAKSVKKRLIDTYQVWTGKQWSSTAEEAMTFVSIDAADDYLRANFAKIMA